MEELAYVKCKVKANEVFEKKPRKRNNNYNELLGIDFVVPKEILEMEFNFSWLVRDFRTGMCMNWKQIGFACMPSMRILRDQIVKKNTNYF